MPEVSEVLEQNRDLFRWVVVESGAIRLESRLEAPDQVLHEVLVRRAVEKHLDVVRLLVIQLDGPRQRGAGAQPQAQHQGYAASLQDRSRWDPRGGAATIS